MSNKTAMQILIDWIENPGDDWEDARKSIKQKATELRDTVEREHIEKGYQAGYADGVTDPPEEEYFKNSKDYYTQTYNQELKSKEV